MLRHVLVVRVCAMSCNMCSGRTTCQMLQHVYCTACDTLSDAATRLLMHTFTHCDNMTRQGAMKLNWTTSNVRPLDNAGLPCLIAAMQQASSSS